MQKLIEELIELEAKATPGPWKNSDLRHMSMYDSFANNFLKNNDSALIIAMRNALPELFEELQAYREEIEIVRKAVRTSVQATTMWKDKYIERAKECNEALARAEKAEAEREYCKKKLTEEYEDHAKTLLELKQVKSERDVLAEKLGANECPYLILESAEELPWCECTDTDESGFECMVNCQEDCWRQFATHEVVKRESSEM